ncbi:hypothetical protein KAS08_03630 [Candidatus Pacearchaeota archaeon]|nr:hypothetical protein [Candidatus Pacearchaeota archaeon]
MKNKVKIRDFVLVLIASAICAIFSFLSSAFLDFQMSYIVSLFLFVLLLSVSFCIVSKSGFAILFSFVFALLTFGFGDLGITGFNKLITLVLFAAVFELMFFFFKIVTKKVSLSVVLASVISSALIPLMIGVLLSVNVLLSLVKNVLNLVLLSFLIGFIASLIALVVWYYTKTVKLFLKFQYFKR